LETPDGKVACLLDETGGIHHETVRRNQEVTRVIMRETSTPLFIPICEVRYQFKDHVVGKKATEDQKSEGLSHTITPRAHRRLCPFGVRMTAVERKLRVIHPR
jgi:hypothetical protein